MGTRIELHQFGPGEDDALFAARRAIEAVDDALTIHRPSPTTAANDCLARGQAAAIDDPLLFDALAAVANAWTRTAGLFDPSAAIDPDEGGWQHCRLDPTSRRFDMARRGAIDFGGFGKGFALDRACDALRAAGVTCAFLSAGESSLATIGGHPLGGGWPIEIPHPLRPGQPLAAIEIEDEALSISSTTGIAANAPGRAPMLRGTDRAVVVAPATTIAIDGNGALAEAMSTALLVADAAQASQLIAGDPRRRIRHVFGDDPRAPLSGPNT